MANQITIKKDPRISGTFKASIFNDNGVPVLNGWQEFNLGADMVWDPGKYGASITNFYIAKGIGPDKDNSFVAYAVLIEFNENVENATITLGIDQVEGKDGGSGCNYFTVVASEGITFKIIKDGNPVAGTKLPERCSAN